jgi:hypothetical protein
MLAELVDALLVSRVTTLDVGRIDLADDDGADPREPHRPRHRVLDLAGRLGAQFVTARAGAAQTLGRTADAFAALCEQARPFRVRPLLVPSPGTPVTTPTTAVAVVEGTRGGVVLDVAPSMADPEEVAELVVEAGDALGYVRVPADELRPDMDAATSLLATVPPQVPLVIGKPGAVARAVAGATVARAAVTAPVYDGVFLAACRAGLDRLLVHPRAVAAERKQD